MAGRERTYKLSHWLARTQNIIIDIQCMDDFGPPIVPFQTSFRVCTTAALLTRARFGLDCFRLLLSLAVRFGKLAW